MSRLHSGLVLLGSLAIASCSSPPVNAVGNYTVAIANGANGCMFQNWDGVTTPGVPLDITQNGTTVSGTVGGLAGASVNALFGSMVFTGNVGGNHLDMVLHGTRSTTIASCTLMLDAHASADLNGDFLEGTITYSYVTNHDTTCPIYTQTCTSVQAFNGTRPPTP